MSQLLTNTRAVKYLALTATFIPFNIWIELTDIKKDYLEIVKLKKDPCVSGYNPDLIKYNSRYYLCIKCTSAPKMSSYLYNKSYREDNIPHAWTQLSREQSQQIIHAYYEAFYSLFYGSNEVSCFCC